MVPNPTRKTPAIHQSADSASAPPLAVCLPQAACPRRPSQGDRGAGAGAGLQEAGGASLNYTRYQVQIIGKVPSFPNVRWKPNGVQEKDDQHEHNPILRNLGAAHQERMMSTIDTWLSSSTPVNPTTASPPDQPAKPGRQKTAKTDSVVIVKEKTPDTVKM